MRTTLPVIVCLVLCAVLAVQAGKYLERSRIATQIAEACVGGNGELRVDGLLIDCRLAPGWRK